MNAIYIVVENGQPYNIAFTTFDSAAASVKEKHRDTYLEQLIEADGGSICTELDVPENKLTGKTYLYVEKGIHIYIHKLPILSF
jgi:hypothetical protein